MKLTCRDEVEKNKIQLNENLADNIILRVIDFALKNNSYIYNFSMN